MCVRVCVCVVLCVSLMYSDELMNDFWKGLRSCVLAGLTLDSALRKEHYMLLQHFLPLAEDEGLLPCVLAGLLLQTIHRQHQLSGNINESMFPLLWHGRCHYVDASMTTSSQLLSSLCCKNLGVLSPLMVLFLFSFSAELKIGL